MDRKHFIHLLSAIPLYPVHAQLRSLLDLPRSFGEDVKMPVFFVGHGDPRNAFRDNPFTRSLVQMGKALPARPNAILVISAHWLTLGQTLVSTKPQYEVPEYKVAGSAGTGQRIIGIVPSVDADPQWELDHGAWAILRHISPQADIPVVELSIDMTKPLDYHWQLARQLYRLRKQGILIIGSGNIVHNLELSALKMAMLSKKPYHWAVEFDQWVKQRVDEHDFTSLFLFEKLGKIATLAVPTVDHYIPLLYSLALAEQNEPITYTYEEVLAGVSMRCLRIG